MQELRHEIRAILREEFLSLRAEMAGTPPTHRSGPEHERVRIGSSADLTRFAKDLVTRAGDPAFAARVERGEVVFDLIETSPDRGREIGASIVTGTERSAPDRLNKALITERDLAALGADTRSLSIGIHSRLTPLARDEIRRRGIRIERGEK